jgi:hypothetical protein
MWKSVRDHPLTTVPNMKVIKSVQMGTKALLMKWQFVIIQLRYNVKTGKILNNQHLGMLCFHENMRSNFFCGHILTEGVFITRLSSNGRILV